MNVGEPAGGAEREAPVQREPDGAVQREPDGAVQREPDGAVQRGTGAFVHRGGAIPGDGPTPAYKSIVFYIVAHQDDWHLFGGERAFADLQQGDRKVVFVHTTAGDAGETSGYWEAREQAAIAAVRAAIPPCPLTLQVVERARHTVVRYRCSRAALYFLRLPDGSPHGTGYEATGGQSLSRLRDSGAPIAAVDGSTTYGAWCDFVGALAAIVAHEREGLEDVPFSIHAADPSEATNPGDHADHTATSEAVQEIAQLTGGPRVCWWRTYCTDSHPPNLAGPPLAHKRLLYRAYAAELERLTTLSGRPVCVGEGEWNLWGDRAYSRWEGADTPAAGLTGSPPHTRTTPPNTD